MKKSMFWIYWCLGFIVWDAYWASQHPIGSGWWWFFAIFCIIMILFLNVWINRWQKERK